MSLADLQRTWRLLAVLPVHLADLRARLRSLESSVAGLRERLDAHASALVHFDPAMPSKTRCPNCNRPALLAYPALPSPDRRHLLDLYRCPRCGQAWTETRKEMQS